MRVLHLLLLRYLVQCPYQVSAYSMYACTSRYANSYRTKTHDPVTKAPVRQLLVPGQDAGGGFETQNKHKNLELDSEILTKRISTLQVEAQNDVANDSSVTSVNPDCQLNLIAIINNNELTNYLSSLFAMFMISRNKGMSRPAPPRQVYSID